MVATTYIGNITERAMLVKLNISMFTQTREDKQASIEVANNHKSSVKMGSYKKQLLPPIAYKTHISLANRIRAMHKEYTLPWEEDGSRIINVSMFTKYVDEMRELEKEWDKATDIFVRNYNSHIEDARKLLNGLFKEGDYLDASEVRGKFKLRISFLPLPQACDFRVDLDQTQLDLLKQDVENEINERLAYANKDVYLRFQQLIEHMIERLKAYKPGDKDSGVRATGTFHNSLINNIRDLVDLIPHLNIAGSQDLTDFGNRVKSELCSLDCDNLREDEKLREDAVLTAEDILAKMSLLVA